MYFDLISPQGTMRVWWHMSQGNDRKGTPCCILNTFQLSFSVSYVKNKTCAILYPAVDVISVIFIPSTWPSRNCCIVTTCMIQNTIICQHLNQRELWVRQNVIPVEWNSMQCWSQTINDTCSCSWFRPCPHWLPHITICMMSWIMHTLLLVLTTDLLEDRHIDDNTIDNILLFIK